jgi:putative transposase
MARHTTFRCCLDPTAGQAERLVRHAGAARSAFNQSLRLVKDGLSAKKPGVTVWAPWSGFDLINAFNTWKKTERAGRVFIAADDGAVEVVRHALEFCLA